MDLQHLADACPMDLGTGGSVLITQEMVDTHAATTGDAQWIHNDPDRAQRESPFGGPIVQGFLLMALLTRLSNGLTFPPMGPVAMMVNYGFDRVRFVAPVLVGAEVTLRGTLAEVRPKSDGAAVLAVDIQLVTDDTVVVAARWLFLVVPDASRG